MALNKIDSTNLKDDLLVALSSPRITSIVYPGDDTAADPAGGQTITIKGGGFSYGAVVKVNGSNVAATTLVDFTTITFSGPALAAGSYSLQVVNADGGTATAAFSFVTSSVPTWSTASGSLGSRYEANTITPIDLSASSDSAVTYSLTSGSLPGGLSLASNGQISGTLSTLASSTTYSFTIDAVDAELQNTSRSFTYTVNADSVTFTTSNNLTLNATANTAITSNTIVATSAAGRTITFSSSSLPTGISINATSGAITGTPTVQGNTASIITATANSTNKSANLTFNFYVIDPPTTVTAAILMVAGGGGGSRGYRNNIFTAWSGGGGGGAGGMIDNYYNLPISSTFTVVVGAGGVKGSFNSGYATNGTNTTLSATGFTTLTAIGGGLGAYNYGNPAGSGGSGGGLAGSQSSFAPSSYRGLGLQPSSASGGYGNDGGYYNDSNISYGVTGGGGAGASVGTSSTGGAGRAWFIDGVTYATGGSSVGNPTDGSTNTGNGGQGQNPSGGNGGEIDGGAGGSGIVKISYPSPQKFTGGTITTVGSNTVHTFLSSGSLVPL